MKPVYFPFTYINDEDARDLCALFGMITVYLPVSSDVTENMQRLSEEGALELKIPVSGDDARLGALIKEYKEWGELHQKSDIAFLKAIGERVPFFDDTFPTRLASQIMAIRDENHSKEKPNILFNARLFLCLAMDYDLVQNGINKDLVSVYEMEKKLIEGLTHEDEEFFAAKTGSPLQPSDDSGKYKMKERIEAWTCLMANDGETPGFFITGSRDAFDFVIERAGDYRELFDLVDVPVSAGPESLNRWRDILSEQIKGLLSDNNYKIDEKIYDMPAEKSAGRKASLKLMEIIDKSRLDFAESILGQNFQDIITDIKDDTNKSIFICFFQKQHPRC